MLLDGVQLLEGSDVVNLTLPSGSSFPASPDVGEVFFKTTDNKVYVYFNTAWNELAGSGSSTVAIPSGSSLPEVNLATDGELFILSTTEKLYAKLSGSWVQLSNEQYSVSSGSTLPTSSTEGSLFVLTSTNTLYGYFGGDWIALSDDSTVQYGSTLPDVATYAAGTLFVLTSTSKIYCAVGGTWLQLSNEASVSSGTTLPATNDSTAGQLFILTTTNKIHGFIGGSWIQLSDNATTPTPNIYDVAVSVPGTITPEATLAFFVVPRAFLLPADLSESVAAIGVNNGDVSFLVYRNSTLAVTVSFTNGSLVGTLTPSFSETVYFNGNTNVPFEGVLFDAGDVFQVFAPATNVPESFAVTFKANIPL